MRVDWCWICRREHPMLDDATFDAVMREYQLRLRTRSKAELPPGSTSRQALFGALQEAYERVTGLTFDGDDPMMIQHYRASYYGPPCPYCGRLLRSRRARQCLECSMDWHDPQNVICHRTSTGREPANG
jgi:hypothetical protein